MKIRQVGVDLKIILNIRFNENPLSGCRIVLCGRTDRHDRANRRSSQFLQTPLLKAAHYLHPWDNYLTKWGLQKTWAWRSRT